MIALTCIGGALHAEDGRMDDESALEEPFAFGGHVEFAYERRRDFDLDRANTDDLDLLPVELQLDFLFQPNDHFGLYFQPTLTREFELREEGEGETRDTELLIEELYAAFSQPAWGTSLQVGRQSFEDARKWLFDEELDAVRGLFIGPDFAIELAASRDGVAGEDLFEPDDEEPFNHYILYGAYEPAEDVVAGAYGLVRDRRGTDADRPIFLGLYSLGTIGDRLAYWLDAAHVRGREDDRRVRGYGIDVLAAYHFEAPLSPYVILGYAFGTGDSDPDDDRDGAFRQTGLQSNEAEVGGLTELSYYGEAFDPELSNLSIFTAGFGARPREGLSTDLIVHYYLEDVASDELRDAELDADPDGERRRLGSEIDLVLGFEEIEDLRITTFLGYFMPGRAFAGEADDALFVRIEVEYEF